MKFVSNFIGLYASTHYNIVFILVMEVGLRGSQWSGTASDNETSPNPLPPLTESHQTSPHLPHKMVADQENFHDLGDQCSETEEKIHLGDKYLFPYTGRTNHIVLTVQTIICPHFEQYCAHVLN